MGEISNLNIVIMKAFAAVALAATVNGLACKMDEYEIFINNFSQGFQADVTNFDNDCYAATDVFTAKTHEMIQAFKDFSTDDWLAPVYLFQEDTIELSNVFADCQTTNAAKQMLIRTTTFGGFAELMSTFASAYIKNGQKAGESALYNSMQLVRNTDECSTFGVNLGKTLSLALNYVAPEAVYYDKLESEVEV